MKKISPKKLVIIITAAIVGLALLVLGIVSIVNYVKNDSGFNYLKSDLTKYIEFTGDYKNFDLNIDIAEPRDIDIDVTIINMLCEDKPAKPWLKESTANFTIKPGDVVYIWYRGYLLDDEGNPIEVAGMSNFASSTPHALEIGSNGFVPGFELDLVGKKTGDSGKFEKITSGTGDSGSVAYVSFTKTTFKDDGTSNKTTGSSVRIDLSDTTVDEKYGEGFTEKIKSIIIGTKVEFKSKIDGKDVTYTDLTVDFVTNCEKDAEKGPIKVNCYFPYDYSNNTDLRNEDAVFEVYIEKADFYYEEMPEFNDEYLKKKIEDKDIAVTVEKLEEYEGETLVDKYRAYAKELMQKIYEAEYDSLVETAIWEHYAEIAKVKKYPTSKVDETYFDYAGELQNLYMSNGGRIYNQYTGSYDTHDTFNAYANAYLGITSYSEYYYYGETAWQYAVYDMAEDFVKERLILYYIMRYENIMPSKEALAEEVELIKDEYLEEYIDQYLENESKTEADYPGEKWDEFKAERAKEIFSYYDDAHFEERAYYSLAAEAIIEWPNVITLDERRAYPVEE